MRQLIALGGGGFSMEPDNPLLDLYILKQAQQPSPKICFIPTASGDSDNYISRFYHFFNQQECIPSHLSLFEPPTRDLESFILNKDIVYVGGGNTKNLLALWKEWELDCILKKAWNQGIILAGLSAGANCWFEEGVTDSYGEGLEAINCLGFLKGSHCPHYDGEVERKSAYHRLMNSRKIQSGIAADDGVAIHYKGQRISKIVSSRPNAKAYSVSFENKVIEKELQTEFLGSY
ncbi:peptidase E [Sporosarcina aquimarina]|uniref:Type 1 glutamine amidotransferase-like domain-containing protein n=1 Tax=Sporosarcina aquimarina TaxID=114975 RepID=UPI00203B4393|nr:peptidase E [Sporosarcina aquimarina]MCM3758233.1 peptidase E [Sporosarcina aquimarina]